MNVWTKPKTRKTSPNLTLVQFSFLLIVRIQLSPLVGKEFKLGLIFCFVYCMKRFHLMRYYVLAFKALISVQKSFFKNFMTYSLWNLGWDAPFRSKAVLMKIFIIQSIYLQIRPSLCNKMKESSISRVRTENLISMSFSRKHQLTCKCLLFIRMLFKSSW